MFAKHLDATYFVDGCTVEPGLIHTESDDRRPFIFVRLGDGLALWGHDPAAFRRIAVALTEAADTLDRTAEQMRAAEAEPEAVR